MFDQKTYVDAKWAKTIAIIKQFETSQSWPQMAADVQDWWMVRAIDNAKGAIIAELRSDGQSNSIIAEVAADFDTRMHRHDTDYAERRETRRQQYLTELDAGGATILPFSTMTVRPLHERLPKP